MSIDLERFPWSDSANRMLTYVTKGWYDKSYVGKWIYEVMGRELDLATVHIEELPLLRKNVDGYEVLSDTKIRYRCTLAENELANTYISEVGLYDADGDMVAMKAFLKKGKDADMECVFECDDTF